MTFSINIILYDICEANFFELEECWIEYNLLGICIRNLSIGNQQLIYRFVEAFHEFVKQGKDEFLQICR